MGNCLNTCTVDESLLAARLESAIQRDSVNHVRAAIKRGAPVNFLYKVKSIYFFNILRIKSIMLVEIICKEVSCLAGLSEETTIVSKQNMVKSSSCTSFYCGQFSENTHIYI